MNRVECNLYRKHTWISKWNNRAARHLSYICTLSYLTLKKLTQTKNWWGYSPSSPSPSAVSGLSSFVTCTAVFKPQVSGKWKTYVKQGASNSSHENVLRMTLFSSFRCLLLLHGNRDLTSFSALYYRKQCLKDPWMQLLCTVVSKKQYVRCDHMINVTVTYQEWWNGLDQVRCTRTMFTSFIHKFLAASWFIAHC